MWISVKCSWCRTLWLVVAVVTLAAVEVMALSGPNVCMVKQKYNITKRIKYRAPMSVRTYEWCFSMPPRCSRWNTEMRDLTRLETEERTAEVAVCCPGYKMKDVSCVPICPNGKTGPGCSKDCQPNRWGPNCVNECKDCSEHGICSPTTGECVCHDGWQGESCETVVTTTTTTTPAEDLLTTSKAATKTSTASTTAFTLITTSTSTVKPTTKSATLSTTPALVTTQKILSKSQILLSNGEVTDISTNKTFPAIHVEDTTLTTNKSDIKNLTTLETFTESTTLSNIANRSISNRTELPVTPTSTYSAENINITKLMKSFASTTIRSKSVLTNMTTVKTTTELSKSSSTTVKETTRHIPTTTARVETTRKLETTIRIYPTTLKFKPKEIWIRPAQKGESPVTEIKAKLNHEAPVKYKNATKIDIIPNTTPKTIIVSIIPTSVSYSTFRKIAFTTASYLSNKNNTVVRSYSKSEGTTKPMTVLTSTVIPYTKLINISSTKKDHFTSTLSTPSIKTSTAPNVSSTMAKGLSRTQSVSVNNTTNRMARTVNAVTAKLNPFNSLTTISSTNSTPFPHRNITVGKTTIKPVTQNITIASSNKYMATKLNTTVKAKGNTGADGVSTKVVDRTNETKVIVATSNSKTNTVTTDKPQDEETFHILTEPEHITAVMSEKGTERSSIDLISVISIAGGVMMSVITVAVIIVMIERCKRPRYEDVRKINDIRMQVMIDNNDVPPPYVRSIFHTPLPDPPNLEKCHYQPISTLDRNLKQFMRPVVVQTISPVMLENFRGILECHYDHLPRRSHDFVPTPTRYSIAPSIEVCEQQLQRASLTESAIEAMKCEAKLDVIDTTTSEPLYAEIPCWRPPSEHAVEVVNFNGEAVTEL